MQASSLLLWLRYPGVLLGPLPDLLPSTGTQRRSAM